MLSLELFVSFTNLDKQRGTSLKRSAMAPVEAAKADTTNFRTCVWGADVCLASTTSWITYSEPSSDPSAAGDAPMRKAPESKIP